MKSWAPEQPAIRSGHNATDPAKWGIRLKARPPSFLTNLRQDRSEVSHAEDEIRHSYDDEEDRPRQDMSKAVTQEHEHDTQHKQCKKCQLFDQE